jgi:hypothetical protein
MKIDINFHWQRGVLEKFDAAPEVIEKAMRFAVQRVTQWAVSQVTRGVAKAAGVQLRVIKGRVHITIRDGFGWVWVGLNPISARRLDPQEVSGGVQAAGRFFPDAFIVKGNGPLAGQVMVRRGPERLPIDKQVVDIEAQSTPVVQKISDEVNARLSAEFERQVKRLL